MAKLTLNDLEVGDVVYHVTNLTQRMAVSGLDEEVEDVHCRWIDSKGKESTGMFKAQELTKDGGI